MTAVLTQRETGGNLSEVLDNLASVIRDRFKVKRQVRVVTAHGRITGWILAGLPPALAGVLCIVSPEHMATLVRDPLGIKMIAFAGTLQVIGTLIIRKLVNVPYLGAEVHALRYHRYAYCRVPVHCVALWLGNVGRALRRGSGTPPIASTRRQHRVRA